MHLYITIKYNVYISFVKKIVAQFVIKKNYI